MKHAADQEVVHIVPHDFKAEVTSIVKDLEGRLDKLLQQHEAFLLKASYYGEQHRPQRDSPKAPNSSHVHFAADVDLPKEAWPVANVLDHKERSVHFSSEVMLARQDSKTSDMDLAPAGWMPSHFPGTPEPTPQAPDVTVWDSRGQRVEPKRATHGVLVSSSSRASQDIQVRSFWNEEWTVHQMQAISKYDSTFKLEADYQKKPSMLSHLSSPLRRVTIQRAKLAAVTTQSLGMLGNGKSASVNHVLHPAGQVRTFWNLISLILICMDAITVPLLVFDIGESGPWQVVAWFCTFFWSADMIVSLRTGYFIGAKVEMKPSNIAIHYAKTWGAFDLFIVLFEWFSRFFNSLAPPGVVRTTRVIRAVRLVKLFRIVKMRRLVQEFAERLNSSALTLIINVALLCTIFCVIGHFVACIWYALGQGHHDGWKHYDRYAVENGGVEEMSFAYWYMSSARWVVSQINGRTDMDERRNLTERGFTIVAGVLLSMVGQSVFVAMITKSVLQLSDLFKKKDERRRHVNSYLSLHPVPLTIQRSVKKHVEEYKDIDVEGQREGIVLALLPKGLKADLLYEVRKTLLSRHPLFVVIWDTFKAAARRLCLEVVRQQHTHGQEMIFKTKDPCSRMLLIDTGIMIYSQDKERISYSSSTASETVADEEEEKAEGHVFCSVESLVNGQPRSDGVIRCGHGMWLSEAALWATWSNRGILLTEGNCCMLEVDAMMFGPAVQLHTDLFGLTVVYARSFLGVLANQRQLSDVVQFRIKEVVDTLKNKANSCTSL